MADILLERNDEAYQRVESVIEDIAKRLQFKHMPWLRDTQSSDNTPYHGRIHRTIPHAFGLFAVEEDVHLLCSTSLRSELFKEHVQESLGLEKDSSINMQNGKLVIPHGKLASLQLSLPNSLDLVLVLHRPNTGTTTVKEKQHDTMFKTMMETPVETQDAFTIYRRTYMQVRDWACRVGIFAVECGLVSEKVLMDHYTRAFSEVDLPSIQPTSEYTRLYKILESNSMSNIPAIADKLRSTPRTSDSPEVWTMDTLRAFVDEHLTFIKIDARCWDIKLQSKMAQHRFIKQVRQQIGKIEYYHKERRQTFSIWPEFCMPSAETDGLTLLIGVNGPPLNENHYLLDHATFDEGTTVEYEVVDQPRLKQMLNFDFASVAQKLPEVYALHLDFSPVFAPRKSRRQHEKERKRPSSQRNDEKFRGALEVFNQLQWDPNHAHRRYEVGYQDRFVEQLLWKPLDDWTKDKLAEDFVPLHRIRQFREILTGEVVWDRNQRIDLT